MTVAMLALAGIPATAGFVGKFYLIDASVAGAYTWLGVVIVIGSMISLGYYLPVIAAIWMREAPAGAALAPAGPGPAPSPAQGATPASGGELPALAGGSPELDEESEAAAAASPDPPVPRITGPQPELTLVAAVSGLATIFFGVFPQPLFNLISGAGAALGLH
jgi:NADH-quinone oxidoreductase subunit N